MIYRPFTCELCPPSYGRCAECDRCLRHCFCKPVGLHNHTVDDWMVIADDEDGHRWFVITEMWQEWGRVGTPLEEEMTVLENLEAENRVIAASKGRPEEFTHDPQYCPVCEGAGKEFN